ncbi:aminoglycoside phosphotransferase family protein [Streptomyces sp. NBC_01261]|uniref:aminoglycoside phosphotransferase family protein n=1 Tax=unclassified Streptomyces TaxID=2593676 RepID=UPI002E2BFC2E|nr:MULTISPECIES: aminoglycoside phosphotransferase family protein [unclassified Streptomyces]
MGAPTVSRDPVDGERATKDLPAILSEDEAEDILRHAAESGRRIHGYHNDNYVLTLTDAFMAARVGRDPGAHVTVRMRRRDVLPVVIRTWDSETEILRAIGAVLKHIPESLVRAGGFVVHSYVEGEPLSRTSEYGAHVDRPRIEQLTGLMAQMAQVGRESLPPLPDDWPADGESQGFLRALVHQTDRQIRQANWPEFGSLFNDLGVADDALEQLADRVPDMKERPYSLLHTDLHRDNVIVTDGGNPPLVCVDWELATYGDPLHDLATHLVRMGYPSYQRRVVTEVWADAMRAVRPAAVHGLDEDLKHYIAFERAQSVYPDIMRAARSLTEKFDQESLDRATRAVRKALKAAAVSLWLPRVPDRAEIAWAIERWLESRRRSAANEEQPDVLPVWVPDEAVKEHADFPFWAVSEALAAAAGPVPGGPVFKGTVHLNSVVRVKNIKAPVVVRRMAADFCRREPTFFNEHEVLQAIESSKVAAAVPRIFALGKSHREEPFAIHTYEGPPDLRRLPDHPVDGLLPHEADGLIDQLCALTKLDYRLIAPEAGRGGFYTWLSEQLVDLVGNLPEKSRRVARFLGLPDAAGLRVMLARHGMTHRRPALLHGDLNPWNLVRRDDALALTLIDWEMAVVGDPLYELVRHMHLTPTRREIRERMFDRWERRLASEFTDGWRQDWHVYRKVETVRSAYIDLDRLVTGVNLDAPNVRRAIDSYAVTLALATGSLGLPARPMDNPHLTLTNAPA